MNELHNIIHSSLSKHLIYRIAFSIDFIDSYSMGWGASNEHSVFDKMLKKSNQIVSTVKISPTLVEEIQTSVLLNVSF